MANPWWGRLVDALAGDIIRGTTRTLHRRRTTGPLYADGALRPLWHQSQDGLQVARPLPRGGAARPAGPEPRPAPLSPPHRVRDRGAAVRRAAPALHPEPKSTDSGPPDCGQGLRAV